MGRNLFAMALALIAMSKCRLDGAMRPAEPRARMLRFPIETISAFCSYRIPQVSMLPGQLGSLLFMLQVHQATATPKNLKPTQAGQVRKSSRPSRATGTSARPVQVEPDIPECADGTSSCTGIHPVEESVMHDVTHDSTIATDEHASASAPVQTPDRLLTRHGSLNLGCILHV